MDSLEPIKRKIYEVRGRRMMLDSHFAEMFQVETKNLKRAVRANIERFLGDFMFELTKDVYDSLRCKIFTLKHGREQHSKYLPFVFTREGIAMLSGLLRSEIAVQANIMRAFFQMQEALLIVSNTQLQLEQIRAEIKQLRMDKQIREPSPDPLSDIFASDEEKTELTVDRNRIIINILKILFSKATWKRNEVDSLCQKYQLLTGSVLEQINDFSYSKIEDAVIEDDGETIYVMTDYKDKLI